MLVYSVCEYYQSSRSWLSPKLLFSGKLSSLKYFSFHQEALISSDWVIGVAGFFKPCGLIKSAWRAAEQNTVWHLSDQHLWQFAPLCPSRQDITFTTKIRHLLQNWKWTVMAHFKLITWMRFWHVSSQELDKITWPFTFSYQKLIYTSLT